MGVVHSIHLFLQRYGLSKEDAAKNFCVLDNKGLITEARSNLTTRVKPFAWSEIENEGLSILEVIKKYKPTCLIGLSA